MSEIVYFLKGYRNDIFKLLPMREANDLGVDNHLSDYVKALIINGKGAMITYPELANKKQYLYVINKLSFLAEDKTDFKQWRSLVLGATQDINTLFNYYAEVSRNEDC